MEVVGIVDMHTLVIHQNSVIVLYRLKIRKKNNNDYSVSIGINIKF